MVSCECFNAEIEVCLAGGSEAGILKKALSIDRPARSKSESLFGVKGNTLLIKLRADDSGALRAAVNSCLRQIMIASDMLDL